MCKWRKVRRGERTKERCREKGGFGYRNRIEKRRRGGRGGGGKGEEGGLVVYQNVKGVTPPGFTRH